jgi:hypothetical protein
MTLTLAMLSRRSLRNVRNALGNARISRDVELGYFPALGVRLTREVRIQVCALRLARLSRRVAKLNGKACD